VPAASAIKQSAQKPEWKGNHGRGIILVAIGERHVCRCEQICTKGFCEPLEHLPNEMGEQRKQQEYEHSCPDQEVSSQLWRFDFLFVHFTRILARGLIDRCRAPLVAGSVLTLPTRSFKLTTARGSRALRDSTHDAFETGSKGNCGSLKVVTRDFAWCCRSWRSCTMPQQLKGRALP
jgi:hypothetical protein